METQYDDTLIYDSKTFYVTRISKGLLSSNPKILIKQPNDAYINIVSSDEMPKNTYRIYFTESEYRLKNEKNMTVYGTFYLRKFKEQNKFIIHKLKKYKKIIKGIRYYYTDDVSNLLSICENALDLYERKHKDATRGWFIYKEPIIYNPSV